MSTKSLSGFVVAMLATIVFAVGCQEPSDTVEHGHDHDHGEHGHVHGPDSITVMAMNTVTMTIPPTVPTVVTCSI